MSVPCPVCHNVMQQSGNPNIHTCGPRKISFPSLNAILEMSHASVYLNEAGEQIFRQIIAGNYSFDIYLDQQKTVIKALKFVKKNAWDHSTNKQYEFQPLITIHAAVDLPWRNYNRVNESVKTYVVFS